MNEADFVIEDHGSIFLFQPLSQEARAWLEEHCPRDEEHMYWCGGLVAEPRYVNDLLKYIWEDGLTVS